MHRPPCLNQLILYSLPKQCGQTLPQISALVLQTWFPQVPHSKNSSKSVKFPPFPHTKFFIKSVCKIMEI